MTRNLFILTVSVVAMAALSCGTPGCKPKSNTPVENGGSSAATKAAPALNPLLDPKLCEAVEMGDAQRVEMLLGQGADANAERGRPLLIALNMGRKDVVDVLLKHGAKLSNVNEVWFTMRCRIRNGGLILKAHGADVNFKNSDGETPLSARLKDDYVDLLRLDGKWKEEKLRSQLIAVQDFIDLGADVNLPVGKNNEPLLYRMVRDKNDQMVRFLVEHGAKVDARTASGGTALMECNDEMADTAKYLIEKGADVNAVDNDGYSVLCHKSWRARIKMANILIGAGANVNAVTKDGKTALSIAKARLAEMPSNPQFQAYVKNLEEKGAK